MGSRDVESLLASVADPDAARAHLAAIRESCGEPPAAILEPLLRVIGASGALARSIASDGAEAFSRFERGLARGRVTAQAQLEAITEALGGDFSREDVPALLRRHKRREILRIGSRDLLGRAPVQETVRELSALADAAAEIAVRHASARTIEQYGESQLQFVVLAMGKHGAGELNYSSDIDLVYLYDGGEEESSGGSRGSGGAATLATRIAEIVTRTLGEVTDEGFVFRVDLRLRPDGQNGPIVNSIDNALTYYESWGQTWERAAMLKARPVAGAIALGEEFLSEIEPFVYRRYLDFETIDEILAMKRKVDGAQKAERHSRDVKLGPGGIREIEFVAQVLQLVNGGRDHRLRRRQTVDTLRVAASVGLIEEPEAEALADAYHFLRDVEHKIQIVEERQTQLLPESPAEVGRLARRLGFAATRAGEDTKEFREVLDRHRVVVRRSFERVFHGARRETASVEEETRHLLETAGEPETRERLRALGFRDPESAAEHLVLLREGSPGARASAKRRKVLDGLAPALFAEIRESADPDLALRHMAGFVTAIGARTSFLSLLQENPETLRLMVGLFSSSETLSSFFIHHPELIDSLVRADLARVRKDRGELLGEIASQLAGVDDYETELDILRRFRSEEFLRIGVNDIHGLLALSEVQGQLSDLAEACLEAGIEIALRQIEPRSGPPPGRFAVIGMGKLGGRELNYNSDLDLIFVWESAQPADDASSFAEYFTRLAQRLMTVLQLTTREGYVYKIDTRLRPSGTQGPLVSTLASFRRHHEETATVWERQALIRARAVAGDPALGGEVERIVEEFVYGRGLADADAGEIARLRGRMEHELARETEDRWNLKTGRGGLVDVEFATQMLQLRHGRDRPDVRSRRTEAALEALHREGLLAVEDFEKLRGGYRFLRALESRLRLDRDQPVETISLESPELHAVARRLGFEGEGESPREAFRNHLRDVREDIRSVYERLFETR